jgi:hypothetical protein
VWVRAVADPLNQGGAETTAGTPATNRYLSRIDSKRRRSADEISPPGVAIVDRCRVWMIGSETVSHRRNDNPEVTCCFRAEAVVNRGMTEDQPAPMDPQQGAVRPSHLGLVQTQAVSGVVPDIQTHAGHSPRRHQ